MSRLPQSTPLLVRNKKLHPQPPKSAAVKSPIFAQPSSAKRNAQSSQSSVQSTLNKMPNKPPVATSRKIRSIHQTSPQKKVSVSCWPSWCNLWDRNFCVLLLFIMVVFVILVAAPCVDIESSLVCQVDDLVCQQATRHRHIRHIWYLGFLSLELYLMLWLFGAIIRVLLCSVVLFVVSGVGCR